MFAKKFHIRIGEFNAQDDINENDLNPSSVQRTPEQINDCVEWMAKQLVAMKSGIVGFVEIISADVLKRAVDQSGVFVNAQIITTEGGSDKRTVALASIYPVIEKSSVVQFPKEALLYVDQQAVGITQFTRPVLRAVIQLPYKNTEVTVFVAHLKSSTPVCPAQFRHDAKYKVCCSIQNL